MKKDPHLGSERKKNISSIIQVQKDLDLGSEISYDDTLHKKRGLRSTFLSSKTLQNLPYL